MFALILVFLTGFVALAQVDNLPQPQTLEAPGPPGMPIDGGIIVLFVLALTYGIYKSYKLSKRTV
ncbi:hypothetical protein HSX10_07250 [Winogradskyella undariae]|nr:hypothetical protein [Winogradskyella undariae]QXP80789.1 hypothetical protein H0I32_07925 [Winogradskyella sp. HaHa_3_26]